MDKRIKEEYLRWCNSAFEDKDLVQELDSIKDDENKIEDAFYRDLEFGTGGLRGVLGAGTNRMNIYVIRNILNKVLCLVPELYRNIIICPVHE